MTSPERRMALALFVIISTVYFATAAGITSSNDGSHYALVRALVDKRSFEISDYMSFTENQDYALRGDLRFSDRPPGTALLTAPFYAASQLLPPPLYQLPSKHDAANSRLLYVLWLPTLTASLSCMVLFWLLRAHFSLPLPVAALTTIALAFGTTTWKYGSLLYSHAASGLLVMLGLSMAIRWQSQQASLRQCALLGFTLGASVLVEYTNVVFAAFVAILWNGRWLRIWRNEPGAMRLGIFALGALVPAMFLFGYNTANFGSPFELSTFNADTTRWPQNESFFTDFATPLWIGLPAMVFYGHDNQGLFWLAPVALVGLGGLPSLWQTRRREFALAIGSFTVMLLLFSTSTTFNPHTNDGRYLAPFFGFWFVAVGVGVERLWQEGAYRQVWRLATLLLLALSIRNQVWHIAFSWGHDFDLTALRPLAAAPENLVVLWQAVFPNALNVPLWWGALLFVWLIAKVRPARAVD